MSISNPYSQYVDNQVMTATPGKILIMAYDASIRFGRIALERMKEGNLYEQGININKMQNIIMELMNTLNADANPQLAASLETLYVYMYDQLTQANINDDEKNLENVIGMLMELRASWVEAESAMRMGNDRALSQGALAS